MWGSPDVASYLGVPVRTLDQWAYLGKGPTYFRVGKFRRYRPTEVQLWLESQRRTHRGPVTLHGDVA